MLGHMFSTLMPQEVKPTVSRNASVELFVAFASSSTYSARHSSDTSPIFRKVAE